VQLKNVFSDVQPRGLQAIHGADELSCAHSCITIQSGSAMVLVKTAFYHAMGTLMPYPSEDPPRLLEVCLPDRRQFMLLAFSSLVSVPVVREASISSIVVFCFTVFSQLPGTYNHNPISEISATNEASVLLGDHVFVLT